MVHHGQRIFEVAKRKGFNKSSLARKVSKSPQAVDYDTKRAILDKDVLEAYASVLNVKVDEFQADLKEITNENEEDFKSKYLDALEENRKLWRALMSNGIKVDLGKFEGLSKLQDVFFGSNQTFFGTPQP